MRKNNIFVWLQRLAKNKLFISVLINIIFCIYALVFGQLAFETNDDREISNLLSDVYNYGDRAYIVFINIIIGYLLRMFYILVPTVNWYVIFSLIFNLFALTIISWCIYQKTDFELGTLINISILIMFYQDSYVAFQFTKNASLYLTAGFLIILMYYKQWKRSLLALSIGSIFMIIGSMLRFQCFEGMVPFIVLICAIEWFCTNKRNLKYCLPLFVSLFASFVLIIGCRAFHLYQYETNQNWSYYREYNKTRAALTDYGEFLYEEFEDEIKTTGITVDDYALIMKWTYADIEIFSLDTMRQLTEINSLYSTNKPLINIELIITFISSVIDICQSYLYLYAVAILVFFVFIMGLKKNYPLLLILGVMFAGWYAYTWIGRIVYRSLYGLILFGIVFGIYYLLDINNQGVYYEFRECINPVLQKKMFYLSFLLIILCSIPQSMTMISNKVYFEENTEYENMLAEVAEHKDVLYLIDRPTLTILEEGYSPYKVVEQGAYENVCVLGGWVYPTPQNNAALERFHIKNPMAELAEARRNLRLIDGVSPDMKMQFLERYYNSDVEMTIEKECPLYTIYEFHK